MSNNKNGSQSIHCTVQSCKYNAHGHHCGLDSIMVNPKPNAHSGQAADESLCGSYTNTANQ